jgi:hypothetical protein
MKKRLTSIKNQPRKPRNVDILNHCRSFSPLNPDDLNLTVNEVPRENTGDCFSTRLPTVQSSMKLSQSLRKNGEKIPTKTKSVFKNRKLTCDIANLSVQKPRNQRRQFKKSCFSQNRSIVI